MYTAFIGAGGGIIILFLIASILFLLLVSGVVLFALRKRSIGTILILISLITTAYFCRMTRPINYHKFSKTALEVSSARGHFKHTVDGIENYGDFVNIRDSTFTISWDGVELTSMATSNVVDLRKRNGEELRYSITGVADEQAFRSFLKKAFNADQDKEKGRFQGGTFLFEYVTRVDNTLDFQITKRLEFKPEVQH